MSTGCGSELAARSEGEGGEGSGCAQLGKVLSTDGHAWEHRLIHHTVASPLGGGMLPSSPQSQHSPGCLSPSRPFVLLVSSS